MNKLSIDNIAAVRDMIQAASKKSPEQHLLHQLHCVCLVGLGHGCYEVARWFGDSPRSLERWVNAFGTLGASGLRQRRPNGRPPRLTTTAMERLALELDQSPLACGCRQSRWDGRLLKQHLSAHYGLDMSLRQCQRTLQRQRALPLIRQDFDAGVVNNCSRHLV